MKSKQFVALVASGKNEFSMITFLPFLAQERKWFSAAQAQEGSATFRPLHKLISLDGYLYLPADMKDAVKKSYLL